MALGQVAERMRAAGVEFTGAPRTESYGPVASGCARALERHDHRMGMFIP